MRRGPARSRLCSAKGLRLCSAKGRRVAGELSQNLRSPRLACLTLLPQTWIFTAHSSLCPPPPALYPKVAAFGVGGGGGKVAGRQHEHQGQGQHRTTSYHIREEQSGRRGALFPPWQGWAPAPRAAARWGFRPAWVVGPQPDLTTWLAGGRPRESHPRAPQPLSVGICPLSPGLSSQEPEFPKPLEPLLPHPAPAPFPAVHFYICSRLLLQHPACTRQEWKMEKVSGRQRHVTLTLSEARSLAQRKWPN